MCGITGFWEAPNRPEGELNQIARHGNAIVHRGPDDQAPGLTRRLASH